MTRRLRMKCPNCGHWNRVSVSKIFVEQNSIELELKSLFLCMNRQKLLSVRNVEKLSQSRRN